LGQAASTNQDHGVYVEADNCLSRTTASTTNVDRGIRLYPDADGNYLIDYTVDGNGGGIIISNSSSDDLIEHKAFTNSVIRHNAETDSLTGTGNIFRCNCLWQADDPSDRANISLPASAQQYGNVVADPMYLAPPLDWDLNPASGCNAVYP
jgi:parallel beta-helix repeat protein